MMRRLWKNAKAKRTNRKSNRYSIERWSKAKANHESFGLEPLESRVLFAGEPVLGSIADVTLLGGSPLLISLNGTDPEDGDLTFSATSSNSLVSTEVQEDNRSMRVTVGGFGQMVFELLENRVPRVTDHIIALADSDFYNGIIFHRVINNFVIQGGDPTGTGSGGSPLGDFDDQFDIDLQHNRTGLLSMAKTTDDTNDSQFFVTEGATRHLDFNHSIFGVLTEGESVRDAISNTPVDGDDVPLTPVVMDDVEIFVDSKNGVLMLKAPEGASGSADITVTVTDDEGKTDVQVFNVTVVADTVNGGPFLEDIPPVSTFKDVPVVIDLDAIDVEGDTVFFDAVAIPSGSFPFTIDNNTGEIEVTPPAGFTGVLDFFVGVRPVTASDTGMGFDFDTQLIPITVTDTALSVSIDGVSELDEVVGYSTQDQVTSTALLEDGGTTLRVIGNGWKKIAFDSTLTVTENTVLSFDYSSPVQSELQGIGLDSDDDVINDNTAFFQLFGTDSLFPNLISDFNNYPQSDSIGDVVHYDIPIGQFITGDFDFLVFFNDDDVAPQDGESVFSNISISEVTDLTIWVNGLGSSSEVTGYSTQDKPESTAEIIDLGGALHITGNGWKKMEFESPITITKNTVIVFDYSSTAVAELQGIGFDNDEDVVNEGTVFFQVFGTDSSFPNLVTDFSNYPGGGSVGDVAHYVIPVGDFITGEFSFLTFFNDDDAAPQDGVSVFSNISLFEAPPSDLTVTVNGVSSDLEVLGYSTQDKPESTTQIEDGGASVRITGNGWKKVVFDSPVTITANTVISFDYSSTAVAELQGIGFDSDEDVVNGDTAFFQVFGTDSAFPNLFTDFSNYPGGGSVGDVVHYEIPVGQFMTGDFSFLTFFNDDDAAPQDGVSVFSNISLFDTPPSDLTVTVNGVSSDLEVLGYSTQDKPESTTEIEDGGASVRITGNGWKKVVFDSPVTITANTVISFDYSSTAVAELQGIGFDSDEDVVNGDTAFFQVFGTDSAFPNLITDFSNYPGGGSDGDVVHYEIPVGQFMTGDFSFLTFFNDDDAAPQDGESVFSNISLFEMTDLTVTVNGIASELEVVSYSNQDRDQATIILEDAGATLNLSGGDAWKKIVFDAPVTITPNTVLAFDFSSTTEAELHGIGFDSDETVNNGNEQAFNLFGTSGAFPSTSFDFDNYPQDGVVGDTVHYEINVGAFMTGSVSFMTFFTDNDASPMVGQSVFSNITLFEGLAVTVNGQLDYSPVQSYSTQDSGAATTTIEDGSSSLRIVGNGWQKIVFESPVTITSNTVLAFDFSSTSEAELHGIGFDSDESVINEGTQFFNVFGTSGAFPSMNFDFHDYPKAGSVGDVVHYEINVGAFITGEFSYLTFFNDDDVAPHDGESLFSNISLFEM